MFESDGFIATAHADCDASAYVLISLTEAGVAERYASSGKFAEKVAPHEAQILTAASAWLDGAGSDGCEAPVQTETISLIGLVNALPVYASAAGRADLWQPGSAIPNARDIAVLADALPAAQAVNCGAFDDDVASKIEKYRTRIFTIRAAHTTGQWSHLQALTKLVPAHQEIMAAVGEWGFNWQCDGVFDLAGVAILADQERAALLKWTKEKIRERLAATSTAEEVTALMTETYRAPALPPVSSFHDIVNAAASGSPGRYGGFLSPDVAEIESLFAESGG